MVADEVKFAHRTTVAVLMAFLAREYVTNQDGAAAYQNHCAICHGSRWEGISPSFPALLGIGQRLSSQQTLAKASFWNRDKTDDLQFAFFKRRGLGELVDCPIFCTSEELV